MPAHLGAGVRACTRRPSNADGAAELSSLAPAGETALRRVATALAAACRVGKNNLERDSTSSCRPWIRRLWRLWNPCFAPDRGKPASHCGALQRPKLLTLETPTARVRSTQGGGRRPTPGGRRQMGQAPYARATKLAMFRTTHCVVPWADYVELKTVLLLLQPAGMARGTALLCLRGDDAHALMRRRTTNSCASKNASAAGVHGRSALRGGASSCHDHHHLTLDDLALVWPRGVWMPQRGEMHPTWWTQRRKPSSILSVGTCGGEARTGHANRISPLPTATPRTPLKDNLRHRDRHSNCRELHVILAVVRHCQRCRLSCRPGMVGGNVCLRNDNHMAPLWDDTVCYEAKRGPTDCSKGTLQHWANQVMP